MRKNNKGFTLIELLAVILILGIIALIAIPTVSSVVEQSRKGACESTGTELAKAAEQYYMAVELSENVPTGCTMTELHDNLLCGLTPTSNKYNASDITKRFDVKGEVPVEITTLSLNANGDVLIAYKKDNYTCSNFTTDGDVATISDKGNVTCVKTN